MPTTITNQDDPEAEWSTGRKVLRIYSIIYVVLIALIFLVVAVAPNFADDSDSSGSSDTSSSSSSELGTQIAAGVLTVLFVPVVAFLVSAKPSHERVR